MRDNGNKIPVMDYLNVSYKRIEDLQKNVRNKTSQQRILLGILFHTAIMYGSIH